jgi:hypothetical protein
MRYFAEIEDQIYSAWSKSASNLTRDGATNTIGAEGGPINLKIELEIESSKENLLC